MAETVLTISDMPRRGILFWEDGIREDEEERTNGMFLEQKMRNSQCCISKLGHLQCHDVNETLSFHDFNLK